MDDDGSGPGWGIRYPSRFSAAEWRRADAWPFHSWQNITAAFGTILWTIWIARRQGRTPLEAVMPDPDRQRVLLARGRGAAGESSASP